MTDTSFPNFMLPLIGFKSRKAAEMAAYFAVKSTYPSRSMIEKLKLIKLIYLSEREFLKQYHLPMLFDEFYSLPHGPICSATLNGIDGKVCPEDEGIWSEFIARNGNIVIAIKKFTLDSFRDLSKKEIRILNFIWHKFGDMTASQLRNYSHTNCPEYTEITNGRIPISYRDVMEALGSTEAESAKIEDNIKTLRRQENVAISERLSSEAEAIHFDEPVIVSIQEYARLAECQKNPARPTQAVLAGAELLRSLRR